MHLTYIEPPKHLCQTPTIIDEEAGLALIFCAPGKDLRARVRVETLNTRDHGRETSLSANRVEYRGSLWIDVPRSDPIRVAHPYANLRRVDRPSRGPTDSAMDKLHLYLLKRVNLVLTSPLAIDACQQAQRTEKSDERERLTDERAALEKAIESVNEKLRAL